MMPLPNHHHIPEFATGGIIPASEATSGDSLPPWLMGCGYGYMMALAARREAADPELACWQCGTPYDSGEDGCDACDA